MSPTEWNVLLRLVAHPGRAITQDERSSLVAGPREQGRPECLRVWISRLRQTPGEHPAHPRIVPGAGYEIVAARADDAPAPSVGEER